MSLHGLAWGPWEEKEGKVSWRGWVNARGSRQARQRAMRWNAKTALEAHAASGTLPHAGNQSIPTAECSKDTSLDVTGKNKANTEM